MKRLFKFLLVLIFAIAITGCEGIERVDNKKEAKKEKMDYLVLVNKHNKLPSYWEKVVELEKDKDAWGDEVLVEKTALKKFKELQADLLKENVDIELDSIYRTVKEQEDLWDRFEKEYGIDYVKKYVAVPGYSEHHTGLAIDVCLKKDGKIIADNDKMIAERKIFAKVHEKLADYGFILRYPEGRDAITGYAYEPWHFRYVGEDVAKEITKKGITLEEYLNKAILDVQLDEGKITSICTKTEEIDSITVASKTTTNYDKNQIATNMKVETTYTFKDKKLYDYYVSEQKKSLLETKKDNKSIQDYLANDKNKTLSTILAFKELKLSKKEKKNYTASKIITDSEKNKEKCEINGATRKELGLK